MNYVHSTVNTVHLSRTAFNKGDGAAAAGPHPRRPVTPASGDYRYRQEIALAVFTPTQHHQDRRRSRAHPANGWWPRCWPSSPTAAASSPRRPAWTSVTSWGWGVPWAAWGRAEINTVAESLLATLKASRRPSALPHPRRSASLDLPLRWRARNRSSAGALGSPVVAGRCPIPQPSGRPPSRRRPPGRKPNERADLLGRLLRAGLQILQRRASRQLLVLDEVAHRRCGGDAVPRRRSRTWWPRCRGGCAGCRTPGPAAERGAGSAWACSGTDGARSDS
jgi:hypothetical protein